MAALEIVQSRSDVIQKALRVNVLGLLDPMLQLLYVLLQLDDPDRVGRQTGLGDPGQSATEQSGRLLGHYDADQDGQQDGIETHC